jgi:catechol 2,3-dioxygenase-like lactoylglutathione lyase family enzyme
MSAAGNPPMKTHLSLNVSDVERSAAFYEAFFGVPVHKRRPKYANFDVSNPALKLALQESPDLTGKGALNHLGIQVSSPEEISAAKERLEQSGLVTFDEKDTTCCYARQDKVWVRDPDGNAWEVYVLLDDMLGDEDHEPEAACCTPETKGPVCCAPSEMNLSIPAVLTEKVCCS